MIEEHCIHVLKCYNETYYFAQETKKKRKNK
jgi:hypothetical protein